METGVTRPDEIKPLHEEESKFGCGKREETIPPLPAGNPVYQSIVQHSLAQHSSQHSSAQLSPQLSAQLSAQHTVNSDSKYLSASKKRTSLCRSNWNSASTIFMGRLRLRTLVWHTRRICSSSCVCRTVASENQEEPFEGWLRATLAPRNTTYSDYHFFPRNFSGSLWHGPVASGWWCVLWAGMV